jgi:hypothetical protein
MPASRARRLYALIDKAKSGNVTASEKRELESMLEEVDRRSFWMLAERLIETRSGRRKRAS